MDLLNLAAEERVNLADLSFALTDSIVGQHAELALGLVLPGAAATAATIVSGFVPAAAGAGGPVTVGQATTVNSAFLCRLGGDGALHPAELIYGGQSVISIDISTFPSNTYGIYVRALRSAQTVQNRAFWSGVDASEYAQLTPTRLAASWEVRIETASPGAEWLRIGQAQVTAAGSGGQGASVVVVDQRPLLFEGASSSGYAPTWGAAADRGARQGATITSLGQMVDALKQCIVDIKGRGLQPWYAPTIGGLLVGGSFGLADAPTNNRIAVGDKALYLDLTGDLATLNLGGTVGAGALRYSRSGRTLGLSTGSASVNLAADGSVSMGDIFTSPAQMLLSVQSHGNQVAELASDAGGGGYLTVSSRNSDDGGSLFFRRFSAGAPDSSPWYWQLQGAATATTSTLRLQGLTQNGALVLLSSVLQRGSPFSSVTNLGGGAINIGSGSSSLSFAGRAAAPGGVAWAVGYFSVGQNAVFASCGGGVTAQGSQASKTAVITFSASLPASNIVMVTPLISSGDEITERCLAGNYKVSGNQLIVQVRNDDSHLVAVDFSFVVFYGP